MSNGKCEYSIIIGYNGTDLVKTIATSRKIYQIQNTNIDNNRVQWRVLAKSEERNEGAPINNLHYPLEVIYGFS